MPSQTLESLLNEIVTFINEEGTEDAQKLWDILAAFRKPDNGRHTFADPTTAVIRHKLGLSGLIKRYDNGNWLVGQTHQYLVAEDTDESVRARINMRAGHFRDAMWSAFRALGLKWEEKN